MPLDRKYPNDERFKLTFDNHPPLYVYWDSDGQWNVDTRYLTVELRGSIEQSFDALFNLYHPDFSPSDTELTRDDLYGLFLLHVVVTNDHDQPVLILSYNDHQVLYDIPANRIGIERTTCDGILDDFRRDSTSRSF